MSFEDRNANTSIGDFKRTIDYPEWHYVDAAACGVYRFQGGHGRSHFVARDPRWWFTTNLHDIVALLEFGKAQGIDYNQVNAEYGAFWASRALTIAIPLNFIGGLHGLIRLLPMLPPPPRGIPVCLMLWGFHKGGGQDVYSVDFSSSIDNPGFNPAIFRGDWTHGNFGNPYDVNDQRRLIRATMALAHAVGYKIILAEPFMSGQVWIDGRTANWGSDHDFSVYQGKLQHAIELGLDGFYFDMAKWSGGYHLNDVAYRDDFDHRAQGIPMPYERVFWLTRNLQRYTGRNDLGFIGQACPEDRRFWEMGYHGAFTYNLCGQNPHYVWEVSERQRHSEQFKVGFFLTDNDMAGASWGDVDHGISLGLFGQAQMAQCPVLLSLRDVLPINIDFSRTLREPIQWHWWGGLLHPDCWGQIEHLNNRFRERTWW